jgi:hypothetical protein
MGKKPKECMPLSSGKKIGKRLFCSRESKTKTNIKDLSCYWKIRAGISFGVISIKIISFRGKESMSIFQGSITNFMRVIFLMGKKNKINWDG